MMIKVTNTVHISGFQSAKCVDRGEAAAKTSGTRVPESGGYTGVQLTADQPFKDVQLIAFHSRTISSPLASDKRGLSEVK